MFKYHRITEVTVVNESVNKKVFSFDKHSLIEMHTEFFAGSIQWDDFGEN